ncbi:MAG: hypothetical protein V1708_05410, partial [Candidatus Micrarchaeota archaeon]
EGSIEGAGHGDAVEFNSDSGKGVGAGSTRPKKPGEDEFRAGAEKTSGNRSSSRTEDANSAVNERCIPKCPQNPKKNKVLLLKND